VSCATAIDLLGSNNLCVQAKIKTACGVVLDAGGQDVTGLGTSAFRGIAELHKSGNADALVEAEGALSTVGAGLVEAGAQRSSEERLLGTNRHPVG
jgi:hypothetical protein